MHRAIRFTNSGSGIITKGTYNNYYDRHIVTEDNYIGTFAYTVKDYNQWAEETDHILFLE